LDEPQVSALVRQRVSDEVIETQEARVEVTMLYAKGGGDEVQQPGLSAAVRTDQQQRITVGKSPENERLDCFQTDRAKLTQDARCGQ
jgi:hypothetical protein